MKPFFIIFSLYIALISLSSCAREIPPRTEFVIGTVCSINLYDKGTDAVYSEIFSRLRELESILSANRDGTNIAHINEGAGIKPIKANPETIEVLNEALLFSSKSNGALDPTVGPLVKAWNIGTDYAAVPSKDTLKKALALIDYRKVIVDPNAGTVFLKDKGMKLDLGAVAKGYAADEIVKILVKHKINKAIIDLGGNVFAMGEKTAGKNWTIGIRDPETKDGDSIMTISVKNKSIVTSGVYERFFIQDGVRYHHILDTQTGFPVKNDLLSVTIVSDRSIDGDALSTTTFLLGTERGILFAEQMKGIDAIFINQKHEIRLTTGLLNSIKILDPSYTVIN